MSDKETVRNLL